MKLFVVLSALFLVALAEEADPHGLNDAHLKCHTGEHVTKDDRINHLVCIGKVLKFLTEDGKVNKEGIRTHVKHIEADDAKADQIVTNCAVDQATTNETIETLWKCLEKNNVIAHQHHHDHHDHHDNDSKSDESNSKSDEDNEEHHGHAHHRHQ